MPQYGEVKYWKAICGNILSPIIFFTSAKLHLRFPSTLCACWNVSTPLLETHNNYKRPPRTMGDETTALLVTGSNLISLVFFLWVFQVTYYTYVLLHHFLVQPVTATWPVIDTPPVWLLKIWPELLVVSIERCKVMMWLQGVPGIGRSRWSVLIIYTRHTSKPTRINEVCKVSVKTIVLTPPLKYTG